MTVFGLHGSSAIVTGGNGGIGYEIAVALATAGARVVIWGRNEQKNSKSVDDMRNRGVSDVVAFAVDVTAPEQVERALARSAAELGAIDILVNNAGTTVRSAPHEIQLPQYEHVLATNLTAAFMCSQLVYPYMLANKKGRILNIGSMFGSFGSPFSLPYSVSKGGLTQLTRSLAVAWAKDGINVNMIVPGWIDTDLTAQTKKHVPDLHDSIVRRTPLGRWGSPTDLGGAAVFLCSAASGFITGASIAVDGGFSVAV